MTKVLFLNVRRIVSSSCMTAPHFAPKVAHPYRFRPKTFTTAISSASRHLKVKR